MSTLASDLRYSLRSLLRAPSFAVAVVAVLALGIGANTAIFGIVNAVLLRPLPYDEPDRLVRLFHVPPQSTFPGMKRFSVSPANYFDWKRDARSFESMAIYRYRQFTLTGTGSPEAVTAGAVEPGFFKRGAHGARTRANVSSRRGRARSRARGRHQSRVLEDACRRRRRRGRTDADARRRGVYHRRHHAGALLDRIVGRRRSKSLGAARIHRYRARGPRQP